MMYGWIIGSILIVILFVAVSRAGVFKRNRTVDPNKEVSPLKTLKNRYAKGEIDKEEYEKRKQELE